MTNLYVERCRQYVVDYYRKHEMEPYGRIVTPLDKTVYDWQKQDVHIPAWSYDTNEFLDDFFVVVIAHRFHLCNITKHVNLYKIGDYVSAGMKEASYYERGMPVFAHGISQHRFNEIWAYPKSKCNFTLDSTFNDVFTKVKIE